MFPDGHKELSVCESILKLHGLLFLQAGLLPGIVCTKISESVTVDYELAVWSQKAKLEARKIWIPPVDIAKQ